MEDSVILSRLADIQKSLNKLHDILNKEFRFEERERRVTGIQELQAKYGELLNAHEANYHRLFPGNDMWGQLYDFHTQNADTPLEDILKEFVETLEKILAARDK